MPWPDRLKALLQVTPVLVVFVVVIVDIYGGWANPTEAAAIGAAACGVDALILSNHGGHQLDGAVAPLTVLPEVLIQTGSQVPILIDSGIRRGLDIAKSLALGASAVLVGRPTLYGLAAHGQAEVQQVLAGFQHELERCLILMGASTPTAPHPTPQTRQPCTAPEPARPSVLI